jgi:hypothetical protein
VSVTRTRLPWGRFIGTGCACDGRVPCLFHYDQVLDWRERNQALARASVQSPPGR